MIFRELSEDRAYLLKDDPVRPELDYDFRTTGGRQAFLIENEFTGDPASAISVAYLDFVPTKVDELSEYPDFMYPPAIAVFYTVWSYEKGYGRKIIFDTVDYIKKSKRHVLRFVTLSPKTEMARKFHLSNGAELISENFTTDNYEYKNV